MVHSTHEPGPSRAGQLLTNQSATFHVAAAHGRATHDIADLRRVELDGLRYVQRDLDGLFDVDLLELDHGVPDHRQMDAAPDRLECDVDAHVVTRASFWPSGSNWLLWYLK